MKTLFLTLAIAAVLLAPPSAAAVDFFVYKATLSLPVVRVDTSTGADKLETRIFTGNDLVNIALGRNLGTPVDTKKTEILAVVANEGDDTTIGRQSTLVIYNLETHSVVVTLATVPNVNHQFAYLGLPQKVIVTATVGLAQTSADPMKGTIFAATLRGGTIFGGASASPFAGQFNPNVSATAKNLAGRMKLAFTDKKGVFTPAYEGFALTGSIKVTGKAIDQFTQ